MTNINQLNNKGDNDMESGIEGNLPTWTGASAVYSKAYAYMKKHGANTMLIDALDDGDEEELKAVMLYLNAEMLRSRI